MLNIVWRSHVCTCSDLEMALHDQRRKPYWISFGNCYLTRALRAPPTNGTKSVIHDNKTMLDLTNCNGLYISCGEKCILYGKSVQGPNWANAIAIEVNDATCRAILLVEVIIENNLVKFN